MPEMPQMPEMPERVPGPALQPGVAGRSGADTTARQPGPPGRAGARERILTRLRAANGEAPEGAAPPPLLAANGAAEYFAARCWPPAERLARLRRCMEAVRAELVEATAATWPAVVRDLLRAAGARTLMAGGGSPLAQPLAAACGGGPPALVLYDRPVEEIKESLFAAVDAGITGCLGGIAETGGLVLCPSREEPRLLSLVPPIHVVLLDPARLWDTLWHALGDLGWARSAPANALVISGPSKTADIEQTLAYGVHGPKRLVVVLVPGIQGLAAHC
jgi:L-lactate dehydrogenase complex protein LldG